MDFVEEVAALPLCARTVVDLAARLPDAIPWAQLAHERRGDVFTPLLLAALHAGRSVPAEVLVEGASLLDDPLYIGAAAARLSGDVAGALVRACDDGRLSGGWIVAASMFYAVCWCQREGVVVPEGVIRFTRWAARRADEDDALATCVAIGALTGDPGLAELLQGYDSPEWNEVRKETTEWLLSGFRAPVAQVVPELAPAKVRSGPKVGRNDACPCGSGKKYKKCCEGKPLAVQVGVRTERDLTELPMWQLARLDPASVAEPLRVPWIEELVLGGEVEAAKRALGVLPADAATAVRARLAVHLAHQGRVEPARELAEALPQVPAVVQTRGATPAKGAKALERLAFPALEDPEAALELAYAAVFGPFPALGIMVARGVMAACGDDDAAYLLEAIHDRRDELLWAPWDASAEWRAAPTTKGGAKELEKVKAALKATESAKRHAEQAFAKTERERARLESEAAKARQAALSTAQVPRDDLELRALREELRALKSEHKVVHEERNALRREVAQWRAEAAEHEAEVEEEEVDDLDADEPSSVTAPMGLRVPELPEGFLELLESLPGATGRAALARLGELCSGRPTGWRETKPLQGFDNVWRVKVGRSYRMLYRVYEGRLRVLDIVHRQDLEKKLHQLHALR